jgi:hypothetical protein
MRKLRYTWSSWANARFCGQHHITKSFNCGQVKKSTYNDWGWSIIQLPPIKIKWWSWRWFIIGLTILGMSFSEPNLSMADHHAAIALRRANPPLSIQGRVPALAPSSSEPQSSVNPASPIRLSCGAIYSQWDYRNCRVSIGDTPRYDYEIFSSVN